MLTGKVFSSHEISLIHKLIKQYNVFIKNNMILVLVWTILSSLVLLFLIYVFFLSFLFQFFNLFYFLQHFKFQKFILLVFLIMFIYHSILLFFYHLIFLYDRMSLSEASYKNVRRLQFIFCSNDSRVRHFYCNICQFYFDVHQFVEKSSCLFFVCFFIMSF